MSANTVIQKIEEKATTQAAEILKSGEERANQAKQDILNSAQVRAKALLEQAQKDSEQLLRAGAQQAALDGKIALLNHKHDLLNASKEAAKTALLALSQDEKWNLYKKLLAENTSGGRAVLQFNVEESAACTEQVLQTLAKAAKAELELAKTPAQIDGGFLLCTEVFDIDCSFDALLDDLFALHEKEISDCLFANEVTA